MTAWRRKPGSGKTVRKNAVQVRYDEHGVEEIARCTPFGHALKAPSVLREAKQVES